MDEITLQLTPYQVGVLKMALATAKEDLQKTRTLSDPVIRHAGALADLQDKLENEIRRLNDR